MAEFINTDFLSALKDLEKEKGISADVLVETIEAALISAYKKNFGTAQNVRAEIDRATGEINIYFRKEVVEEVMDENNEISLEEARAMDEDFELGDLFESEVTPRSFGRIAAQTAKQVVLQRIKEAERSVLYDEYIDREGDIISGVIVRIENGNIFIEIGRNEGILPQNEQIPGEHYAVGDRIKVYISEVRKTTRGAGIVLSRTNVGLLRRLLELEVPEIYEGTVELKNCVREAGAKAKIAVYSNDSSVDAVGACVGARGARVQQLTNELSGEKMEVIQYSENPQEFIASAMSPAKVVNVLIDEKEKFARVVVPDHQLSLAIGKEGQNARLAVRLTGWKIDIKSETQMAALIAAEEVKAVAVAEVIEEVAEVVDEVPEDIAE